MRSSRAKDSTMRSSMVKVIDDSEKQKKKTKLKEQREMTKLFTKIAKEIMQDFQDKITESTEKKCRESVTRGLSDLQREVFLIEGNMSSRLNQLEGKFHQLMSRIEEINTENNKQHEIFHKEISELQSNLKSSLEHERTKRNNNLKKVIYSQEQTTNILHNNLRDVKLELTDSMRSLNEDFKVYTKELSSLKEKVDDMLLSRHGPSKSHEHGNDNPAVINALNSRIQRIESYINHENQLEEPAINNPYSSPLTPNRLMSASTNRLTNHQTNRLKLFEEELNDLSNKLRKQDQELNEMKYQVHQRQDFNATKNTSHQVSNTSNPDLEKKLRRLAENVTKACRSLSNGLTDIQQATLTLYAWSDKAHHAFNIVAQKVDLPLNICPRAKLNSNNNTANLASSMMRRKSTSQNDFNTLLDDY